MYHLLIVDDEEDIRRGMAKGIPWDEWGFEVAGQAGNGQEAVAFVEKQRPDVVLTDIRMPKMDGIELMQYLHKQYPEVKIIILSGYNDVEYLKLAIKNQVTEYLLKPTDIDEFEALFHRLRDQLNEEQEQKSQMEAARQTLMQNQELSYGRLLSNLLDGYVGGEAEHRWKKELEEAGMDFNRCVLAVFETAQPEGEGADSLYELRQKTVRYCNSREDGWIKRFFLYHHDKIVGIITLPEGEEDREQAVCYTYELQSEAEDLYGLSLIAGISRCCQDEKNVPRSYEEALREVAAAAGSGAADAEGLRGAADAESLRGAADAEGLRGAADAEGLRGAADAEGLRGAADAAAGQKKGNLLVYSVKEYLDGQYCSNSVSLEAVAEHFRKNPAYISKVFKKETGFNFSDYITQKRMEKSKELLKDMSLKIYEIAEMTGYADASNFIKVFKKHCGMSPNEYRSVV